MKCPSCWSPLVYKGGENKEDHGCWNMNCPARVEAAYYSNVKVRNGWWFSAGYTLPFKHNNSWYCVVGPCHIKCSTELKQIHTFMQYGCLSWNRGNPIYGNRLECTQETVWTIPYMALPVCEPDFNRELDMLISKFDRYLNKLVLLK
jgi:hypothetical protein